MSKGIKKQIIKYTLPILCLIPIALYFIFFHDSISFNNADWGDFGDYIGGVYSIIMSIVVVYLSYYLTKKDVKKAKKNDAIENINKKIHQCESARKDETRIKYGMELKKHGDYYSLYISESLKNHIIQLADQYIKNNVDVKLKKDILNQLKQAYDD